jgi:flavin reductase
MQTKSLENGSFLPAEEHRLQFRDAMARLGAAVNIVTTDGPGGMAGFAATAVCSVSDSPPTLLVCINRSSSAYPAVSSNRVLCVNVLESGHVDISRLFGGKTPMPDRFKFGDWTVLSTGSPALENALASFDCRISGVLESGTHDILICEVATVRKNADGRGLVYFDRKYFPV